MGGEQQLTVLFQSKWRLKNGDKAYHFMGIDISPSTQVVHVILAQSSEPRQLNLVICTVKEFLESWTCVET